MYPWIHLEKREKSGTALHEPQNPGCFSHQFSGIKKKTQSLMMSSHFFADHPSHPLCFCQATNLLKVDGPVDMVKNQWVNEWEIFQYQRTSAQNHRILCTPPSSLTNSSPKKGRTFNRKYIPNSQVSPTCPLKPSMVGVDVCFSRR